MKLKMNLTLLSLTAIGLALVAPDQEARRLDAGARRRAYGWRSQGLRSLAAAPRQRGALTTTASGQSANVERFGPGDQIGVTRPGDFLLTHDIAWTSRLIRFGQRRRFRGRDGKYARWNHAALFVDERGTIVEALNGGVCRTHVSKYAKTEYHVVRIEASAEDRAEAARFAESCVGLPYGRSTIASIALSLATGTAFAFGFDGQHICSGLVARALERTQIIFPRAPMHMMPADLARHFRVEPPPPGTSKGTVPK